MNETIFSSTYHVLGTFHLSSYFNPHTFSCKVKYLYFPMKAKVQRRSVTFPRSSSQERSRMWHGNQVWLNLSVIISDPCSFHFLDYALGLQLPRQHQRISIWDPHNGHPTMKKILILSIYSLKKESPSCIWKTVSAIFHHSKMSVTDQHYWQFWARPKELFSMTSTEIFCYYNVCKHF